MMIDECFDEEALFRSREYSDASYHPHLIVSYDSSNQPPTLSNGYVTPTTGDTFTTFYYYVTYSDPDGDAPTSSYVKIDGNAYEMTKISGDFTTGATYRYYTTLSEGSHHYFFYFNDGHSHPTELPSSGTYPGPTVTGQNQPPTAFIDSITPDPAEQELDTVSFIGGGTDSDGYVVAYNWRSSIDGQLSTSASFSKSASELSIGTHTIYFKVQDDDGAWSTEVTEDLTIIGPTPPALSPTVKFLDKNDTQREVAGATADGESKVIVQISNLPSDITMGDISVQIISEGDGNLEDDATIEGSVFTQTYTAPEDFVRATHPEDRTQGYREIDLSVKINGQDIESPNFYLVKPPVVLVHGLWSDASTWHDLSYYLHDNYYGYASLIHAYSYPNDRSFSENRDVVGNAVRTAIEETKKGPIVVKQADVVAHSTGGVLTNMYITSDTYRQDINRVITIATPHSGSHIANYALQFLFNESQIPRKTVDKIITVFEEDHGRSLTNGAVEDLQVGSSANLQLIHDLKQPETPNVPVYAICCNRDRDEPVGPIGYLYYLLKYLDVLYCSAEYFHGTDYIEKVIFGTDQTDFIVSCESQRGGSAKFTTVNVADHYSETDDENVMGKVCELLNSPVSEFDPDGFNPVSLSPPVGPVDI